MGKLIMWNMVTLDGYFEGRKAWDIDWHSWGDELEELSIEQLRSASMLLFGRRTYEGMADYWSKATAETDGEIAALMNELPKVVFSSTMEKAGWNNTRLVKGSAEAEVTLLKQKADKPLFIFGSAELSASLMKADLIDEFRLGLNPVILGGGNPLFKAFPESVKMRLLEARPLRMGCVILRYERER